MVLTLLDELLDIAVRYPPKEYRGMEITLMHALNFLAKFYLQFLDQLAQLPTFRQTWSQVLNRMEMYMKAKLRSRNTEKLQELVPTLLREILQVKHSVFEIKILLVISDTLKAISCFSRSSHVG